MAKYMTFAPDGNEVNIGLQFGRITFKHFQTMENDELAAMFPMYFQRIEDAVIVPPVEEATQLLNENKVKAPKAEKPKAPKKEKKTGKKNLFKRG